jgi:ferredoxin-NADP reductase
MVRRRREAADGDARVHGAPPAAAGRRAPAAGPVLSVPRHRADAAPGMPALLLHSARTPEDVIARDELMRRDAEEPGFYLMLALARAPDGRRIDAGRIAEALAALGTPAHTFACGGNPFVSAITDLLVEAGLPARTIRTERFGG